MKKIEIITRTFKLDEVKDALAQYEIEKKSADKDEDENKTEI